MDITCLSQVPQNQLNQFSTSFIFKVANPEIKNITYNKHVTAINQNELN